MSTLQGLYTKLKSNTITKHQFVTEVAKRGVYKECFSTNNSFDNLIFNLKRKGFLTESVPLIGQQSISPVNKISFDSPEDKEIYIVSLDDPESLEYIFNDKHRRVNKDDIRSFMSSTYDNTDDRDDVSIATEFLIHNQDKLDEYPIVKSNYSLDELGEYKNKALKVVKAKSTNLNESLTYDQVSSHQFNIGFSIEFDKLKDPSKASKKVLDNLEKDPSYYTNLLSNYKEDENNNFKKSKPDNLVDEPNGMKKVKPSTIKESENIIGGLADNKPDHLFDPQELEKGINVELEHTNDRKTAKEIAKDHLTENPKYYTDLEKANIDEDYKQRLKEELLNYLKETGKPSSGLSKAEKSAIVKKAKQKHDFGKKGKGFDKIVSKAEKSGYPEDTAKKIAGSIF